MVSSSDQNLLCNFKISSVGPSRVTGTDITHEPNGIDLAMKLHYLHAVYFFSKEACQAITIMLIKESLFYWCNEYYLISGRFRRSESGRPYVKCNDCGVRIVEAQCDKTINEWLEMKDSSLNKLLVYHLPIGPEISFSPLCYMQVTKFKCGGLSMGFSWAHVVGDPISISQCINTCTQFFAGLRSNGPLNFTKSPKKPDTSKNVKDPLSLKRVDPVGDLWVTANNCKMETFSVHLTATHISHLLSSIWGENPIEKIPLFESLCAIMWQIIAKVREEEHQPKIVTICKKDPNHPNNGILSNSQIISTVQASFPINGSNLEKLVKLLVDQAMDEKNLIEKAVEKENGSLDYLVYGANLTFLDISEANLYELEWNGNKPIFVHYNIQGVGDEGVVLVLPWPEDCGKYDDKGRVMTITLPENEAIKVKSELEKIGLLRDGQIE